MIEAWVAASSNPEFAVLVDARAADRYRGEVEPIDPVAGHIPGAMNRPFMSNLNEKGRFKSASELQAEFLELLGDADPASVVHTCGSGISACHNLLAMEAAGLAGSALYPGSWSEWCGRAAPIALGGKLT
jgi:thiosulfate/3-mercaptopyruvate sulfurtransferase